LQRAASALAAADGIAHAAFFGLFAWRTVMWSGFGRVASLVFAVLSVVGLLAGILGGMVVRFGGRSKARTIGLWGIGLSTGLAGILLVAASWMSD
jgi:hypothetical protein